jgi:serine protease AprX
MKTLRIPLFITSLILSAIFEISPYSISGSGSARAAGAFLFNVDSALIAATANGARAPFLLVLRDQADLTAAAQLGSKDEKGDFVFNAVRVVANRSQPAVRATLDRLGLAYRAYYIVNSFAVEGGSRQVIEQLAARADIARIEANSPVRMKLPVPQFAPELLPFAGAAIEWGVSKINAPSVWAMGFTGRGVVYANADTGVQWDHPALKNQYRGWNGVTANHNYNWWDAVHQDVSGDGTNPCGFNLSSPCDDYGHGTHTLGTGIGAAGMNRIGVAPGARWIACRNMEQGVGRPSQYIECFQFFLAPWDLQMDNANPKRAADVISNSWTCSIGAPPIGEDCTPNSLKRAAQVERAAGIFVVAAAGNGGDAGCSSVDEPPAIYDAVVTVGASDAGDNLAEFSSLGPVIVDGSRRLKPDLVAPGVSVRSSFPGNLYAHMSGTSMSAPHLAGAIALLWSAHPELRGNVNLSETLLLNSANHHVSAAGKCGGTSSREIPNNLFGYGRVDVLGAVTRQQ